jgi:TPR repeat protein
LNFNQGRKIGLALIILGIVSLGGLVYLSLGKLYTAQSWRTVPQLKLFDAAVSGSREAEYELGRRYLNGEVVAQNDHEAAYWIRKAAEKGQSTAEDLLGDMYELGRGVDRSSYQAAAWFKKSAAAGNAYGEYSLAMSYLMGLGVRKDPEEALGWLSRSAESGHVRAQLRIAWCYEGHEGLPTNEAVALKWYSRAAKEGSPDGQFAVGYYFLRPGHCDYAEARKWLNKAAEQNYSFAEVNLGLMYAEGLGVPTNEIKAVELYRRGAEHGNLQALSLLADCYLSGHGVPKNGSVALSLFQKAAAQGYSKANDRVKELTQDTSVNTLE